MMAKLARKTTLGAFNPLTILGLGMALCIGALPAAAQQNQPDLQGQTQGSAANADSHAEGQTAPPAKPPQNGQLEEQSAAQAQSQAVLPQTLTLPAGTVLRVRVDEWLSSDRSVTGDSFSAILEEPIVVGGWVVARRGQAQTGRVSIVKKGRSSALGVDLPELTLVDGQQLPLQTQLFQTSSSPDHGRDVAVVGTTTGMGAVIGEIAGGGLGAAIGAGVGATAGIIGVKSTDGRPAVIAPETVLSFRLQAPVTISTANSQFAFQPVTQSDYDSRSHESRARTNGQGAPPPPYYPYGYPYPFAYGYPYPWYPGPFIGFGYYGGYGRYGRWR